ncbi:MAG TPA: bifunctional 2-polyprenyl-6-hydroxyphenol methylase/3-demethylubiquinol 3-O-methyltransferase UbiG [Planctomycetota bacterium]|nr:bifunctional 2-polyprenyl-6-hydroxyphenol methylase/3-demethylubiquinol 3-O-methyltransferase UbiG [Planctomycetota bacterium]
MYQRRGWWDPRCRAFASLRRVNAFRLQLLQEWLPELAGRTVVDIGCGGGLLAAPLAAAGAHVLGVDRAPTALADARAHSGPRARFVAGDARALPVKGGTADLVLLADVLEHVTPVAPLLREAVRLLRPGGMLFVSTINRTWRARWLAVTLGEGLRLLPRGTHDPRLFLRPEELLAMAANCGLVPVRQTGERPALLRTLLARAIVLRPAASLAIGYNMLFRVQPQSNGSAPRSNR